MGLVARRRIDFEEREGQSDGNDSSLRGRLRDFL